MSNEESCSEKAKSLSQSEEMSSASSSQTDSAQIREGNMLQTSQTTESPSECEEMPSASSLTFDYVQASVEVDKLYKMLFSDPDDRTKVLLSLYEKRQAELKELYKYRFDGLLYDAMKKLALKDAAEINKMARSAIAEFEEDMKKDDEIKLAIDKIKVTEEIVKQYEENVMRKALIVEADVQDIRNQASSSAKALQDLCHRMANEINLQEEMEQDLRKEHDCVEDLVKKLNVETKKSNALVQIKDQYTKALANIDNLKVTLQKGRVEQTKLQDEMANLEDSLKKKENQMSVKFQKMDEYLSMNESAVIDMRKKVENIQAETAEYRSKLTKSVEDAKAVLEADIKSKSEALDNFDDSSNKILDNLATANENLIEMRNELYEKKEILQQEFHDLQFKLQDSDAKMEMLEEEQMLQEEIELKERDSLSRPQLSITTPDSSESSSSGDSEVTIGTAMTGTSSNHLFKKPIPPTE